MATNRRLLLHEIFCEILGTRNAYFQPPESVKMNYPAIVYGLDSIENTYANDGVYLSIPRNAFTINAASLNRVKNAVVHTGLIQTLASFIPNKLPRHRIRS